MSEQTKEIELLPCQCESPASFHTYHFGANPFYRIKCDSCLMMTDTKFCKQELADCWNHRQPPAENDGQDITLKNACEQVLHLIRCHMVYEKDARAILEHALESVRGGE